MEKAQEVFRQLVDDFGFKDSTGKIMFELKDISIVVRQNNVVGNILEEWIDKWMTEHGIPHKYNLGQSSPDFWLNLENEKEDWLEVKSFTKSPNFDLANYLSYINLIIQEPWKLHSSYLIIKYSTENGVVRIKDCWLKKVWEISCASEQWAVKVQCKKGLINNIRPSVWYSKRGAFPSFKCLEDFLSALEEVVYTYHETHSLGSTWKKRLVKSYKDYYGKELDIPRWMDIRDEYVRKRK